MANIYKMDNDYLSAESVYDRTTGKTQSELNGTFVRPNLLDNWYFVGGGSQAGAGKFPINQRGQTSYTNAGYGIDRWRQQTFINGTLSVNADGITINTTSQNAGSVIFDQKFSDGTYSNLRGKTITASILVKSISGKWNVQVPSGYMTLESQGLYTRTFNIPNDYNNFEYGMRIFNTSNGSSITIEAVKLELGDTQTLAHQEGNTLVLNEIPDYAEQLAKCQRYYIKCGGFFPGYGYDASTFMASISLPVTMVKAPTVSASGTGYFIQDIGHSIASVSNTSALFGNGVRISGSATVNANKMGFVSGLAITLSAEL